MPTWYRSPLNRSGPHSLDKMSEENRGKPLPIQFPLITEFPVLNLLALLLAACLEVGGDALMRKGMHGGSRIPLILGVIVLTAYGVAVNLPGWSFGRLMGVYIAAFFVVAQLVAVFFMHERLASPTMVGGAFIIVGGIVMTVWHGQ